MNRSRMVRNVCSAVYIGIYQTARWFLRLLGRADWCGLENIPEGGCIIACNHQSHADPPFVGCTMDSLTYFFARKSLFDVPVVGFLLRRANTIPVDRDGGSDVAAFKKVFTVLKSGNSLIMFPEGTRSKDGKMQEAKAGVGLMACKMRVPVVPVRVFGTSDLLRRGAFLPTPGARLSAVFLPAMPPAEFDPGEKHPERFLEASRRIMARIAEAEPLPEALL